MEKTQTFRMQRLARHAQILSGRQAVYRIAHDRMVNMLQVNPNLVRAASVQM